MEDDLIIKQVSEEFPLLDFTDAAVIPWPEMDGYVISTPNGAWLGMAQGHFCFSAIAPPLKPVINDNVGYMHCPTCGNGEKHPTMDGKVLIRGNKFYDRGNAWSQCLVCSGYYDHKLKETPKNHDENKGWFIS